jgi:hypothetical protein
VRLSDVPARLLDDLIRTWRRRLIAAPLIGALGIIALFEIVTAARLGLEHEVGPIQARLILAAVAIAAAIGVVASLIWFERRAAAKRPEPIRRKDRVATIAEAVDLGYSLGQEFRDHGSSKPANTVRVRRGPNTVRVPRGPKPHRSMR